MSIRRHREVIDAIEKSLTPSTRDTLFERSFTAERSARIECGQRGIHFGLPSHHARHFDADGSIVIPVRLDRKLERLRMDPARPPQHKVHQHGQEKHYAVV